MRLPYTHEEPHRSPEACCSESIERPCWVNVYRVCAAVGAGMCPRHLRALLGSAAC